MALSYEVVVHDRAGKERVRRLTTDESLAPGSVLPLDGRWWLVQGVEGAGPPRATVSPARYRLRLVHPDGREELGVLRRFRPGGPRLGHAFATLEDGLPVSWQVEEELLAQDEEGEAYLDLVARRDFAELEELPDHELEHALSPGGDELPEEAAAILARAEQEGLEVELVALDPGEAPDWDASERYLGALILEEIEDDLLEQCGVRPDTDPRETWLETVRERLQEDLRRFRSDVEGHHDEIEVWDFRGGRVYASVGTFADESDPGSGHGWLCRLLDASVLGAAGFERVRKGALL
jgi:hypothetical protein